MKKYSVVVDNKEYSTFEKVEDAADCASFLRGKGFAVRIDLVEEYAFMKKYTVILDGSEDKVFSDFKEAIRYAHPYWLEGRHVFISPSDVKEEKWSDQPVSDEVLERCISKNSKKTRKNR